jgi:hypothetical protein
MCIDDDIIFFEFAKIIITNARICQPEQMNPR